MSEVITLKNAKGYRSAFINKLNEAVKRYHIIGGDVTAIESEVGTRLYNKDNRYPTKRFELFAGIAETKPNELYYTACVGNGSLYIDGQLTSLHNATGTVYKKQGVMPRGAGWFTKGKTTTTSPTWSSCDVVICKYNQLYWLVFRFDTDELWQYFEGADSSAEIEMVTIIGKYTITNDSPLIEQYTCSDIYISSGAGASPVDVDIVEPWLVRRVDNVWSIYMPNIIALVAPYAGQLGLWQLPSVYSFLGANGWVPLASLGVTASAGYLNVSYNPLASTGTANISISSTSLTSTSRQFTVGMFEADSAGNLSWSQWRKGHVVFDVSRHSPAYVANLNYQGVESLATDITSSAEGCYINRTHWLEFLTMGDEVLGSNNHTNGNGEYVIATMGQRIAFKASLFNDSNTIKQTSGGMFPNEKASGASTVVATQEEQTRVEGILTDTPTDETQQGRVYAGSRSSIVWVAQASGEATETDILYTEVEEANEATTYSDSSGLEQTMGHPWDNMFYRNDGKGDMLSRLIADNQGSLSYCDINERNPTTIATTPIWQIPIAHQKKVDGVWHIKKAVPLIGVSTVLRQTVTDATGAKKTKLVLKKKGDCKAYAKLLVSRRFDTILEPVGTHYYDSCWVFEDATIDWRLANDVYVGDVATEVKPYSGSHQHLSWLAPIQVNYTTNDSIIVGLNERYQQRRNYGNGTLLYSDASIQEGILDGSGNFTSCGERGKLAFVVEGYVEGNEPHPFDTSYATANGARVFRAMMAISLCNGQFIADPHYRDYAIDSCGYNFVDWLKRNLDGTNYTILQQIYNLAQDGYAYLNVKPQKLGHYAKGVILSSKVDLCANGFNNYGQCAYGDLRQINYRNESRSPQDDTCNTCGSCGSWSTGDWSSGGSNKLAYMAQFWNGYASPTPAYITISNSYIYNLYLDLYKFWLGISTSTILCRYKGTKGLDWDDGLEDERKSQIINGVGIRFRLINPKDISSIQWYVQDKSTKVSIATVFDGNTLFISPSELLDNMGIDTTSATSEQMFSALNDIVVQINTSVDNADAFVVGNCAIGNIIEEWMPS